MSGLLRRIRPSGAAAGEAGTEPETGSETAVAPLPPAPDGGSPVPAHPALPAGVDAAELERRPSTRSRRGLRRRARFLRRARELMLRDLGGVVYESHRRGPERAERLIAAKAERLEAVSAELRELDAELGVTREETVLRVPGIGGSCPACGELHPSEARFCAHCGEPLGVAPDRAAPAATASEQPTREEPAPANGRATEPVSSERPGS